MCSAWAARPAPHGVLGMGRPGQQAGAGLRPRRLAPGPRLRRAGPRDARRVPRRLPRRGRPRRIRLARRPDGLRAAELRRRHGDAARPARCRQRRLGRHLDGRADRHGPGGAAGLADRPAGAQRHRPGDRRGRAGAHRRLSRPAADLGHRGRGRRLPADHLAGLRPALARGMAGADAADAAQGRRAAAPALRPGHRRADARLHGRDGRRRPGRALGARSTRSAVRRCCCAAPTPTCCRARPPRR